MSRRFAIELAGITAEAVLHEDAPELAGRLWEALPLDGELRHVRWSGEAGYVLSRALAGDAHVTERVVSIYSPGAIVLRPEHGELAFAYGQGQARDNLSRGSEGAHIATVVTGLEPYLARVAETRRTGVCPIKLRRVN